MGLFYLVSFPVERGPAPRTGYWDVLPRASVLSSLCLETSIQSSLPISAPRLAPCRHGGPPLSNELRVQPLYHALDLKPSSYPCDAIGPWSSAFLYLIHWVAYLPGSHAIIRFQVSAPQFTGIAPSSPPHVPFMHSIFFLTKLYFLAFGSADTDLGCHFDR